MPVRITVSRATPLREWLASIQQAQVDSSAFEWSPLVQVQSWSDLNRGQKLFDTLVVYENYPTQGVTPENSGLQIEVSQSAERTNLAISFAVSINSNNQLEVKCLYTTDRFDTPAANTLTEQLLHAMTSIASITTSNEDAVVGDVSMNTPEATHRQVVEWNSVDVPLDTTKAIHSLVEAQAEANPDAIAVCADDEQISFGELNRRSNQLAHFLVNTVQLPRQSLVAVCLNRSTEFVVSIVAILKAGCAYVPIDTTYPASRQAYLLQDSAALCVITSRTEGAGLNLDSLADLPRSPLIIWLESDWRQVTPFATSTLYKFIIEYLFCL